MGRVIGRGGGVINTIREESGARIDAEDRGDDHCEFKINGTKEQVRRAKEMIREQADRVAMERGHIGDEIAEEDVALSLQFPASIIYQLIGPRGAKINEVREKSGAKVQVKKREEQCEVAIAGGDEQVASARELLAVLAEAVRNTAEGHEESLDFPLPAYGRIIGPRGAQIAEVRLRSGAQVKIEKLEECCRVYLVGTPEQVDRGKRILVALVEDQAGRGEDVVEIPQSSVGRVIGKGGETVQRLQRESGAKIDVKNQLEPPQVRITGSKEAIMRAKYLLWEVLERNRVPDWRAPMAYGYDAWAWPQSYMAPSWDAPAGDGGGAGRAKEEEIDLDEL